MIQSLLTIFFYTLWPIEYNFIIKIHIYIIIFLILNYKNKKLYQPLYLFILLFWIITI